MCECIMFCRRPHFNVTVSDNSEKENILWFNPITRLSTEIHSKVPSFFRILCDHFLLLLFKVDLEDRSRFLWQSTTVNPVHYQWSILMQMGGERRSRKPTRKWEIESLNRNKHQAQRNSAKSCSPLIVTKWWISRAYSSTQHSCFCR